MRRPVAPGAFLAVVLVVATAALALVGLRAPAVGDRAETAREIAAGLRCPVCEDLSAADSPAPLAGQMRAQIRSQLAAGRSPAQIRAGFVASYGDSVLMSPPARGLGRVAHLLPVLVLGLALACGLLLLRRWRHAPATLTSVGEPARARQVSRPPSRPRRPRRVVTAVVVVAVAGSGTAGTAWLLHDSLTPLPVAATAAAAAAAPPSKADAEAPDTRSPVTDAQLVAVRDATAEVRRHPRGIAAHLALARAYAAARQQQLSTVEYLAAARLDPDNAEAGTGLALAAFTAGQAREAATMLDHVLSRAPRYPEALYVRGLVRLMGLRRPEPARADLAAYLRAAPFGSHRATVATLLAMIPEAGR